MGHEFQDDKPRNLTPGMFSRLPRDLPQRALHSYSGQQFNPNDADYQDQMLRAIRRQSNFHQLTSVGYDTDPYLVLPATARTYFMIQNVDPTAILYVGFGVSPTSGSGIYIAAVNGYFEPYQIPQNEIWIAGNAAGSCNIIYAND